MNDSVSQFLQKIAERILNNNKPKNNKQIKQKKKNNNNSLAIFCAAYAKMSKSSISP